MNKLSTCAAVLATVCVVTTSARATNILGIDVSSGSGSINWTDVKADGVVFAFCHATTGYDYSEDSSFTNNMVRGKAAGVQMGAIHFSHLYADTPAQEANYFWNFAGPYIKADGKTFMPMLDMEVFTGLVGASTYSIWANDWCADIVADASGAGVNVKPVIYVSACNACNFNTSISQWLSSIADYNSENPETGTPWSACNNCDVWGSGVWDSWQYSDTGSVSGVPVAVDRDVFNGGSVSSFAPK